MRSLWCGVVLVLAFCSATRGGSGDFEVGVQIVEHSPSGTHLISGELSGIPVAGSLSVAVDSSGRATAELQAVGTTAMLIGKYKFAGRFEKLRLRGGGAQSGLKLNLSRFGDGRFEGKLKGGSGVLAGKGRLTADGTTIGPLVASASAATRNGTARVRLGHGTAAVGSTQIPVDAKVKLGRKLDRIKFSGEGFRFSAKGEIGESSVALSYFRLKTHGVVARGRGTMGFAPNGPDVALILASGHPASPFASSATPYLSDDVGVATSALLTDLGLQHTIDSFVDHSDGTASGPGLDDMVSVLELLRDRFVVERTYPTRVVVIAHSHGGVRAHTAIWQVPDLPITALVDLDASSCLFKTGHLFEAVVDPVDAIAVDGRAYDLEDVVFPNVRFNLDVRSGELCVNLLELYDDARNIRTDGTTTGLWFYEPESSDHSEVHSLSGTTVGVVMQWLSERLTE